MTHVTCRLTAKNLDQLRNPTLANRLWATFYAGLPSNRTEIYAARMLRGSSSDRWIPAACARPYQQTGQWTLLLSSNGTDSRTSETKGQAMLVSVDFVYRDS